MTILSASTNSYNHYYIKKNISVNQCFNIRFPFLENSEYIKTYIILNNGEIINLKLGLHYEVILFDQAKGIWGKIKFLQTIEVLGGELYICRNIKNDQNQKFASQTVFPNTIEKALDKLTMLYQDMSAEHLLVHAPYEEALNNDDLLIASASKRAGKMVKFGEQGNVTLAEIEELPTRPNSILSFNGVGAIESLVPVEKNQIYVSVENGKDANDGLTLFTPKKTINAALNIAEDHSCIFLAPGIYNENLEINQIVHIQGLGATLCGHVTINKSCSFNIYSLKYNDVENEANKIISINAMPVYINIKMVKGEIKDVQPENESIRSAEEISPRKYIIVFNPLITTITEGVQYINIKFDQVVFKGMGFIDFSKLSNAMNKVVMNIYVGVISGDIHDSALVYQEGSISESEADIKVFINYDVGVFSKIKKTDFPLISCQQGQVVMRFKRFITPLSGKMSLCCYCKEDGYIDLGITDQFYNVPCVDAQNRCIIYQTAIPPTNEE